MANRAPLAMGSAELAGWNVRLEAFAKTLGGDSAHDVSHLRRVVTSAGELAQMEGAGMEVILPAAWLHDCVAVPKDSAHRARAATLAAERAVTYLREIAFPEVFLDEIAHCIEAHSFSGGVEPRTLEARVLRDADRLDALGAIGIARCFAVGGSLGRAIHLEDDPFCIARNPDDSRASLDHFFQKLLRLPATMTTAAGRREADRRVDFMKSYLDRLGIEIAGGWLGSHE